MASCIWINGQTLMLFTTKLFMCIACTLVESMKRLSRVQLLFTWRNNFFLVFFFLCVVGVVFFSYSFFIFFLFFCCVCVLFLCTRKNARSCFWSNPLCHARCTRYCFGCRRRCRCRCRFGVT